MKPIDGLNLKDLIEREEKEHFAEREDEVLKVIRGIMQNRRSLRFQIDAKQKELNKLLEAEKKADDRLKAIENNNWDALGETNQPKTKGE